MLVITLIRIAITLTFLILAAGGPYAIHLLQRFIRRYSIAHKALEDEVKSLKDRVETMEKQIKPHGDL